MIEIFTVKYPDFLKKKTQWLPLIYQHLGNLGVILVHLIWLGCKNVTMDIVNVVIFYDNSYTICLLTLINAKDIKYTKNNKQIKCQMQV